MRRATVVLSLRCQAKPEEKTMKEFIVRLAKRLPMLLLVVGWAFLLFASSLGVTILWAFVSPHPDVLDFRIMVGVEAPFTGTTNAVRGIPGAPGPWSIQDAKGELRADGHLRVTVDGLVISAGPVVGTNPLPNFRAIVSCQSRDGAGAPSVVNVSTSDFPATLGGDSHIEETLSLPSPCIAPIVFVTSSTGVWLAATGH
jgi:hypothetical protein